MDTYVVVVSTLRYMHSQSPFELSIDHPRSNAFMQMEQAIPLAQRQICRCLLLAAGEACWAA